MLKKCANALCRPLELIFNDCLANGMFISDWKKDNIVPVHKKNYKQRLNNYRPVVCNLGVLGHFAHWDIF